MCLYERVCFFSSVFTLSKSVSLLFVSQTLKVTVLKMQCLPLTAMYRHSVFSFSQDMWRGLLEVIYSQTLHSPVTRMGGPSKHVTAHSVTQGFPTPLKLFLIKHT